MPEKNVNNIKRGYPSPTKGKIGWPWTESSSQLPATMPGGSPWPRISIVTPSYNQAQYLEEAIRSVLLQGYPNLEYIVMDGSSTDGSVEILRKYEPWLTYLHIGPDEGQAAAIKDGFERATGEILAWLNSDDRYRPGALHRVAHFFLTHPKVVFGNGDVNFVDNSGQWIKRMFARKPNRFLTSNLGVHGWPQQGCFWRRWVYERVGGIDPSLHFCMDLDLFIRLIGTGPGRRIPGPPLGDFRIHDQAKSSNLREVAIEETTMIIKKYGAAGLCFNKRFLLRLWRLWHKPVRLRRRLYRRYGWEL